MVKVETVYGGLGTDVSLPAASSELYSGAAVVGRLAAGLGVFSGAGTALATPAAGTVVFSGVGTGASGIAK